MRRHQAGFILIPALWVRLCESLCSVGRECRAAWRLARMMWLLLWGVFTVRFLFPHWSSRQRQAAKQAWSRKLLRGLGVKPPRKARREDIPERALIVCNHISWLDIYVINAMTPTHFVSKEEVRSWPVIGWLVEHTDTVFIERGSRTAAARTAQTMAERLQNNERVAVFPEGTTTLGNTLLPFRPALFQAGIEAQAKIQPMALRYVDRQGHSVTAPAYAGDTSFWECLRAIVLASGLRAELQALPPISTESTDRRDLNHRAERAIADALGLAVRLQETEAVVLPAAERSEEETELVCLPSQK